MDDGEVDPRWTAEFLADPRHHLAVALDADQVVGKVLALHRIHPDKAPQLWINEVGVAPSHQGMRLGCRLIEALLALGRTLECSEAWVLADGAQNRAATPSTRARAAPPRRWGVSPRTTVKLDSADGSERV